MFIKAISRLKVRDINFPHVKTKFVNSQVFFVVRVPFLISTPGKKFFSSIILFFLVFFQFQQIVLAPIFFAPQTAEAQYDTERLRLEKELQEVEKQIAEQEQQLQFTRKEKATLQNKINELKQKAEKLRLQIQATNTRLSYLNVQIADTTESIIKTNDKINKAKNDLAVLIQAMYEMDQISLLEIILGGNKLSNFFDYLNILYLIQERTQENVAKFKDLKKILDDQHNKLTHDKEEMQNLLAIQLLQRNELEETKKEQEDLLRITKGKEERFQSLLTEFRKRATEIRGRIYELIGIQTRVTFGEALDIANWVSGQTGVRPALILAVLTQESNIGKNVGTCNRPGDPPERSWRAVMKPDRDHAPFLQITRELGMDPDITPVSCPMKDSKGNQIGWGGAMGPAQFIPSTWLRYRDRVTQITGKTLANPWDIRDAFVACALYLANWGATKKTREAEWRAAMIYFSGTTNTRFRFYGDSVMAIADRYERDIEDLRRIVKN